ncbi:MAG TPA: outer membrane protein assembly factor BamA [Sedimenticola sp.]|nr:outer membrane protein assembly factor BamA [Sedimenticola sp.]
MLFAPRPLTKLALLCMLLLPFSVAAGAFVIKDIRVEGLQRISAGTVFNYLPVTVGQTMEEDRTADIIRALYKTGFFKDVRLEREGNVLVISVKERPAVASISFSGNEALETEQLLEALKDIGLAEGRVFNRSVLDKIEQELRRQYFSQGKYGVKLTSTVTPLERNRVAISIDISEGRAATIKNINIVGNEAFDEEELLDEFQLSTGGWLSFYLKDNQYSRQKLSGDLEALRSFYLDRGYINFKIESTQVSITPDKKDIYVTININEGDIYTISDIKLAGKLEAPKEEMFPLIHLSRGQVFSRKAVVESSERINDLLGNHGYAFANVNSIPEIDEEKKQVAITFFVDPGKRVYVRRINLRGNTRTRDQVLRRELRQMESAWFSAEQISRSRDRLRRLGYFEDVTVETPAVPGSTDQVDVNVTVKEKPAGNMMAGIGYSQSQGVMFNTSISQSNFLGTGKRVAFAFNNSSANREYRLAYTNPYYTIDGISRGFNLRYRETKFYELDSANYSTDTAIAGVNFGIPISEFDRLNFTFDVENTKFNISNNASNEIREFESVHGNTQLNYRAGLGWMFDSRDSIMFPTRGGMQRMQAEVAIPGSDVEYYKISYKLQRFFPLTKIFTLGMKGHVGYGDGYRGTETLPFYKNFFAGGFRSVRGFAANTLGPRDSKNDPLGGNFALTGGVEVYFKAPFKLANKSLRLSLFADAGNVYDLDDGSEGFELEEMRYSTGVSAVWASPMGVLTFSLAQPFNTASNDDKENFQFQFGSAF